MSEDIKARLDAHAAKLRADNRRRQQAWERARETVPEEPLRHCGRWSKNLDGSWQYHTMWGGEVFERPRLELDAIERERGPRHVQYAREGCERAVHDAIRARYVPGADSLLVYVGPGRWAAPARL